MMDLATGTMRPGIGHYAYAPSGDTSGTMTCNNPYPCEFDFGIIEAAANKFKPATATITVQHALGMCRQKGAESCAYTVAWQ